MTDALTNETVELLQQLIRNRCVNDGTPASGDEIRNSDLLQTYLEGSGLDVQRFDAAPGRRSLVARIAGSDPNAPSLCLMGHTDVVPVNEAGWTRDPFGGELVNGEVWGRGAVDMLNLTSSMAVAFRHLADTGFRPKGDLIYFAVADEESGSAYGMRWMADHAADAIRATYVLSESGGLHSHGPNGPTIGINVGEKGVAWRRLRISGTPGHGSRPYKSDNALVTAAAVVNRLSQYRPAPKFHELWPNIVDELPFDDETKRRLRDETQLDAVLDELPVGAASHLHACSHTTFSPNTIGSGSGTPLKHNVIPDSIEIGLDVRTLPGETAGDVDAHLRAALGDAYERVDVEIVMNDRASIDRADTPLWDSLQRAIANPFPTSRLVPQLMVGFTDARIYRELGSTVYGAALFSPDVEPGEYGKRFHGNDERVDVESLRLTTQLWLDVARDLLGS